MNEHAFYQQHFYHYILKDWASNDNISAFIFSKNIYPPQHLSTTGAFMQ